MSNKCQAPGMECENCRLKCQLPLIEAEKAQRERREEMSRLTEQEAKQALITAQCAAYPRLDVAEYLKPMYTYVEQTEAELNRLQVALEATIAEKGKYKRALKIACEVNSDMFATSEEAMIYCIRQATGRP